LDPDTTNPSMSTELLAFKERRAAKIQNRKKLLLSFGIILVMIIFIGFGIIKLTIEERMPPPEPTTMEPATKKQVTTEPASTLGKSESPSNVDADTRQSVRQPVAVPETINIRFKDIPRGATILFNQQPVSAPIELQKSDTPQYLEVKVGKKPLFSTTLVPDRDRLITLPPVDSEKEAVRKKRHDAPASPSESSPTKKQRSGKLSSNPFPLKQNPFSTGE
jgi:hypothetical protein